MRSIYPFLIVSLVLHGLFFLSYERKLLLVPITFQKGATGAVFVEKVLKDGHKGRTQIEKGSVPTSPSNTSGSLAPAPVGIKDGAELGIAPPPYPEDSRLEGEEGTVIVLLSLDSENKLVSVELDQSSTYSRLDRSVLQHISKNFPVSVTKKIELQTKVRFHFKLK